MSAVFVEILSTKGSAPRDAGTAMKVTANSTQGTIGGGALEHEAIAQARRMLATDAEQATRTLPLGPGLGQCCGGVVTLGFSSDTRPVDAPAALPPLPAGHSTDPLWVWGAGHVGRAVVAARPDRAFDLTWIDDAADRFPPNRLGEAARVIAADMPLLATRAPLRAHHLIFTYSHDIDLALCAALLKRQAASIGLIGSDTKRRRFFKRLREMGLDPAPITCPIGDKARGKHPDQIAYGTLLELMKAPA